MSAGTISVEGLWITCRGSIVAIDSAVPRREEGARTDDDMSTSSMVSLSRGLPSVPSIASMPSPSHLSAAYQQSAGPMAGSSGSGTTFVDPCELPSSAALKVLHTHSLCCTAVLIC